MLESRTLWISKSEVASDSSPRRSEMIRTVRWEFGGREVGWIVAHPLRWWPWKLIATMSAFEGPDRSAVFAGRRAGWWPGDWDVHEADGRLVGLVRGAHVLYAAGEILGQVIREQEGAAGRIVSPGGSRLVEWKPLDAGTRIEFDADLDEQPFAKMAVIIAVLIGL
jgi:hypothetical protein